MQNDKNTSAFKIQLKWLAAIFGLFITGAGLTFCVVIFSAAIKRSTEIRFSPNAANAPVNVRRVK